MGQLWSAGTGPVLVPACTGPVLVLQLRLRGSCGVPVLPQYGTGSVLVPAGTGTCWYRAAGTGTSMYWSGTHSAEAAMGQRWGAGTGPVLVPAFTGPVLVLR